jgi:predicted MFS family arabinose efflux permease
MVALASFSVWARFLTVDEALMPALTAVAVWGFAHWGFFPAQQSRLIGIVGVKNASLILSLNASFMYLGFSLGAALGSFVLVMGGVADLGWIAGLCVLASLTLFMVSRPTRTA